MKHTEKQVKFKAFSLLEMIFYLSLLGVLTTVIASFWGSLNDVSQRNTAMASVNTESAYMLNQLTHLIRQADSFSIPGTDNTGPLIELSLPGSPADPTVISLSNGDLTVAEGGGPAVSIKGSEVEINQLEFSDVSAPGTPGAVRILLEVGYKNDNGSPTLNYTQTYYDTVSFRD